MSISCNKKEIMNIQVEASELSSNQKRIFKSLNNMLSHVSTTDDESEFFEASSECMRLCAALIKQSNFAGLLSDQDEIPYADQAIEYSVDVLQEHINNSKVVTYDN